MLGVAMAVLTALAWAGSSVIVKFLTAKIDTLSLNTLRLWMGSILLLLWLLLSGRGEVLFHTEWRPLLLVMASGVVAIAVGDTIYIKSLSYIDVSRAFPITQCTSLAMIMLVAALLLGETFTWLNGLGAALVILGVYLVAVPGKTKSDPPAGANARGVMLALAAAVTWTIGAAALKLGAANMDSFVAAAIRIPISAAAVTALVFSRKWGEEALQFEKYGRRNMALVVCAGILSYGVGAVGYVKAMQLIGAGRTVMIMAIAPILILPFSVLILRERLTGRGISGILTAVAGVYLVV